ncbi:MAG: hypothetical protein GDA49_12080 [Rhodospirillales bacterium]|nr:hypothetical protein [Rhodospirillales bacterium]
MLSWIRAAYLFLSSLQVVAKHALRGLKDSLVPMWLMAASLWGGGLAGGPLLACSLELGAAGLWYALAGGTFLASVLMALRFERLTRTQVR